jgi:hypothetical protein
MVQLVVGFSPEYALVIAPGPVGKYPVEQVLGDLVSLVA